MTDNLPTYMYAMGPAPGTAWLPKYPKTDLQHLLEHLRACLDARRFVGRKTRRQLYDDCPKGTWFMWIIWQLKVHNCLTESTRDKAIRAFNARANGVTRINRLRAAIPFTTLNKALTKYRKSINKPEVIT